MSALGKVSLTQQTYRRIVTQDRSVPFSETSRERPAHQHMVAERLPCVPRMILSPALGGECARIGECGVMNGEAALQFVEITGLPVAQSLARARRPDGRPLDGDCLHPAGHACGFSR